MNPSRCWLARFVTTLLVFILVAASPSAAKKPKEEAKVPPLAITTWLVLGPTVDPLPIFHDEKPGGFGVEDLLKTERYVDDLWYPATGGVESWFAGGKIPWEAHTSDSEGLLTLKAPAGTAEGRPAVAWLAAYLATDRWQSADLQVRGTHPRRAWLDGDPVALGGLDADKSAAEVKGKLKLTTGNHLLLLETVFDPAMGGTWSVGAALLGEKEPPRLTITLDPRRELDLLDVLDAPKVGSVAVSPDGSLVAASVSRVLSRSDESESWVEVRGTADGAPRWTWRGGFGMGQVAWAPTGKRLSYVTTGKSEKKHDGGDVELGTVWLADIESGVVVPLLQRVENLAGYAWSPDGNSVAYWVTVKPEPDKRGVKRLEGLLDRQASHRTKTSLNLVTVPGGTRRRLTAGPLSTGGVAFSPDGHRLLFVREVEDLSARPYSRKELWEIDLVTFEGKKLRDGWWMESAQYAPDGKHLLILGGPSEFGAVGANVPQSLTPNEGDGQLYIWDPDTTQVDAITREFDPAVQFAFWSRLDGNIYIKAEDRDAVRLFRYIPTGKRFEPLETGFEVVDDLGWWESGPKAVLTGTSPWEPEALAVLDLKTGASRILARPAEAWFAPIRRGRVESWSCQASTGTALDGRVYLPPGLDPARKAAYPAIVYYYGGTSPVSRDFGGRYPKEWWAAQGYVVYVLQPSGATGYGQAHSALHVNEWGGIVASEIIEGTRQFLEAHPYVDPKRVGCIGASFGGFMTELLVTKTELFAAAVSHAGISSISSYWGEGYWGYSYSAQATAGSFPWNRKDIYIDRSPLFGADRVKTPLLLTHGASDTNVPVGESDTFYTALKLLGAPVEYVQVEGQDHWIVDHAKRIVWSRTIVAWFDRWLKGQPGWWEDLYPKPK